MRLNLLSLAIGYAIHCGPEGYREDLSTARRNLYFEYGHCENYAEHVIAFIKAYQPVEDWLQRPQDRLFQWQNYNRLHNMRIRMVGYDDVKIIQ